MTENTAKKLERGAKVIVRGEVRSVHSTGRWVEVQFATYSLNIPIKDVRLPKKRV